MSESEDYEYAYSSDEDGIDDGGTMEWDDNAPENPNAAPSMSSSSTYPKRKYTKALWVASREPENASVQDGSFDTIDGGACLAFLLTHFLTRTHTHIYSSVHSDAVSH